MCKKIDQRVTRTKKYFKDALILLLSEKSFDAITINDITQKVDYSRASFYAHYNDKYQLLDDVVNEVLDGLRESLFETLRNFVSCIDGVHPCTINLFTFIQDHSLFFKTMFSQKRVPGFVSHFSKFLFSIYQDYYVLSSQVNQKVKIELKIHLFYVTSAMVGVIGHWIKSNMKYSPQYMAEQLMKIIKERPQKVMLMDCYCQIEKDISVITDRRVQRSKLCLKEALIFLLEKNDFEGITISDICKQANYNRKTFYAHYRDKMDLMMEMIDEIAIGMIKSMNIKPEANGHNEDQPLPAIVNLFNYIMENKTFFLVMTVEDFTRFPKFLNRMRSHLNKFYYKKIKILLEDNSFTVDWDIYIDYISSVTLGVTMQWVLSGYKQSPMYMAEQFTQILYSPPELKPVINPQNRLITVLKSSPGWIGESFIS